MSRKNLKKTNTPLRAVKDQEKANNSFSYRFAAINIKTWHLSSTFRQSRLTNYWNVGTKIQFTKTSGT